MYRSSGILKKVLAVLPCLSVLIALATTEPVQAERKPSESLSAYINRCYNSIQDLSVSQPTLKFIASAYLVGEDDMAAASWLRDPVTHTVTAHELYAVDPDTEIQGRKFDSKYFPQDNREYLKDMKENYGIFAASGRIYNMPEGAQYIEREGCMFLVVACDEEWVTIWDRGYQSWNPYYASSGVAYGFGCTDTTVDGYLETHPAGFYKIQRNKVWIDFNLRSNHPYQSEAEIPKAGNGVVTKLVNLRPVPDETEKQYTPVYALPKGTEVNVVSTQLVPSKAEGSTHKYYKVSFNGSDKVQNNTVQYLKYKVPGVYYLDSRFLNFKRKGTKTPEGAVPGEIINVKKSEPVYAYRSRDTKSERIGVLSLGVEIEMFPSESDADWTTVYFSGQKVYVQTKYIKRAPYKVTAISKPRVADIVNDEIKMGWNVGSNNVEYACSLVTTKGKVLWSDKHYKKNRFIIKRKYIEKYTALDFKVQATDKNGKKGKMLSTRIFMPRQLRKIDKKRFVATRTKIKGRYSSTRLGSSIQYATNKKFRKAVTREKYYKKGNKDGYKTIASIKKLKPGKTYYIRHRLKKRIYTAAGYKWLSGKWSKAIKIKTKK